MSAGPSSGADAGRSSGGAEEEYGVGTLEDALAAYVGILALSPELRVL